MDSARASVKRFTFKPSVLDICSMSRCPSSFPHLLLDYFDLTTNVVAGRTAAPASSGSLTTRVLAATGKQVSPTLLSSPSSSHELRLRRPPPLTGRLRETQEPLKPHGIFIRAAKIAEDHDLPQEQQVNEAEDDAQLASFNVFRAQSLQARTNAIHHGKGKSVLEYMKELRSAAPYGHKRIQDSLNRPRRRILPTNPKMIVIAEKKLPTQLALCFTLSLVFM